MSWDCRCETFTRLSISYTHWQQQQHPPLPYAIAGSESVYGLILLPTATIAATNQGCDAPVVLLDTPATDTGTLDEPKPVQYRTFAE